MQIPKSTQERYNVNKTKTNNVKTLNVNGNDVKRIAHYLAEKLDDYRSVNFFYTCAWRISEQQLMIFLENAQKPNVRNPRAVFTWQCNQIMQRPQASAAGGIGLG